MTASNVMGEGAQSSSLQFQLDHHSSSSSSSSSSFRRNRHPILLSTNRTLQIRLGSSEARLPCKVDSTAAEKISIKRRWSRDGAVFRPNSKNDELVFNNVKASDAGSYTCHLWSLTGESAVKYKLVVQDVPRAPKKLNIAQITPNSMQLFVGGNKNLDVDELPLLACSVFYKQKYGSLNKVTIPPSINGGKVLLRNLQCGRTYQIYSRCSNILGAGTISEQTSQTTLGHKPKVQADKHHVVTPSNDSVRIDLFRFDDQNCPVSYFVVEYRRKIVIIYT